MKVSNALASRLHLKEIGNDLKEMPSYVVIKVIIIMVTVIKVIIP